MSTSAWTAACLAASCAAVLSGCRGETNDLGRVEGTVTLDGRPLAGARVEFQPRDGSPSYAVTDADGHYELWFTAGRPGALVGTHTVRITSAQTEIGPDGSETRTKELLPAKYHRESTLRRAVKRGNNRIDLELHTAPAG